ncbi:MAG: hypothetical protein ACOYB1_18710 [Limnohabitans sp.]
MKEMITFEVKDMISPHLARMAKHVSNFTPVMARVEREVLKPLRLTAWGRSGLRSRSGQLFAAVETWHGKRSAGVTLKSDRGHDLILPKAMTQAHGAKKNAFSRRRKKQWKVKSYSRIGLNIRAHVKSKGPLPWGDIPARPFVPDERDLRQHQEKISQMVGGYIQDVFNS